VKYTGLAALWQMIVAISLVISYFSGPMVNFSDFSRFATDMPSVKKGNFWGLPVNFVAFSIVTVITTSATFPVFGEYIHDPVEIVARVDNTVAVILGAATFIIATIGINIVANFVSPAFDFSNVSPKYITFLRGGMIAAVGSILVMPWNLFSAPAIIHYTLDTLGAAIGPLYGILVADYFIVKHERLFVDDLYDDRPTGHYYYKNGFNTVAAQALGIGFVTGLLFVFVPRLFFLATFSWAIGALVGGCAYVYLMRTSGIADARAQRAAAAAGART
jgi:NCS1 family nucleobase:cation symporter-1